MLRTCAVLVGILLFTSSFTSLSNVYSEESTLPDWVKNIFVWFGEGVISESELLGAIEWLIENNIIKIKQISELAEWKEQASKLYSENQELKDDIAFLENRIASLTTSLKSTTQEKTELKTTIKTQQETAERDKIELLAKTNPLVQGLISGQLKFYIEPVPSYASPYVAEDIEIIANSLEKTPFYQINFKRVYSPSNANLQISWIKDYGSHTVGEAIFKSVVKVGIGRTNCLGDWQAFDSPTILMVFWHELGHSLGFGHSNNPNNIMYSSTDTKFDIDYEKTITLDEGEYMAIPFCNGGSMAYQASTDDQYNGFYIYALPPETNAGNFINNNQGQFYSKCSAEDVMISYGNTCNVADGSKLLLYNYNDILQFDAIRIDVKIIDMNERQIPDVAWDFNVFQYDQNWLDEVWNMYH